MRQSNPTKPENDAPERPDPVEPPMEPCDICGDPTPGGGTCENCQAW